MNWGSQLKKLMQNRGWRNKELAIKSGIKPKTLSRMLRGDYKTCSSDMLEKFASAFGMSVSEFASLIYSDNPVTENKLIHSQDDKVVYHFENSSH